MHRADHRSPAAYLAAPLVGTGVLMAAYLLLRPYGDAAGATTMSAAEAFASPWWIAAHVCGALALASVGRLALRVSDLLVNPAARIARWTGLAGVVLVLPYYGAETFGLHALGREALATGPEVLALVDEIRNQSVALTTFGIGLVLLAISGLVLAWTWQRASGSRAAWPLGLLVALVLPQFYLPPAGRMAVGVAYAAAAAWWLVSLTRGAGLASDPLSGSPRSAESDRAERVHHL